jgi:capreomycidine synthase
LEQIHELPLAPMEEWLRDHYFAADIDISASGVEPYALGDVREMIGLGQDELDRLVLMDGHSYGDPEVRRLIAERWGTGDPSQVMTTNGSSEAIFLVLTALLRPGDEVVVVEPGYHALIHLAATIGCEVKPWRMDHPERVFGAALDDLDRLMTERTRAVIVSFPHNPTGISLDEPELQGLLGRAAEVGAWVVWDAAFNDITYDAPPLPNVVSLYERALSFGTFSKSFGMPGLRFGWCISPDDILRDCVRVRDYVTLHLSPLVELVARRSLENLDALLQPRLDQARHNREILRDWAEAHGDDVSLALPAGGVASFPRLDCVDDVDAFAFKLMDEHGVLVIPGSCFDRPRHVRLGFGGPTGELVEGLERFDRALAEFVRA